MEMARYGQAYKARAEARLLPPESAAAERVADSVGVGAGTLQRWRDDAQYSSAPGAGLYCGGPTGGGDHHGRDGKACKSAWCREHGVYPAELDTWRASATAALAAPEKARATACNPPGKTASASRSSSASCCTKTGRWPTRQLCWRCQKNHGDLQQRRGRMIGLADRRSLAHDIETAYHAGARLRLACDAAGVDERTLQRWKANEDLVGGDGRPQAVRPAPGRALSLAERGQLLCSANEPRFAAAPPARIVPMLADKGVCLTSESTCARGAAHHGQSRHRCRCPSRLRRCARPPRIPPRSRVRFGAGT